MIIKPRTRGFICTTAHPIGASAQINRQIQYVINRPSITGPKNVLIIGSSTGYGLASRIVAAFAAKANTVGVYLESKPTLNRTGSAGWYNSVAFEKAAEKKGLKAYSILGDAFSKTTKEKTIALIRQNLGQVDLVIYSVATSRRTNPHTGKVSTSVLKPLHQSYTNKTVNFHTGQVSSITLDPATNTEIDETIDVMGGDDWQLWIESLQRNEVLAANATTLSFSYIGPEITQPIYRGGSIGLAKQHLEQTAKQLNKQLSLINGRAYVVIGKALVTQSSSAIPIVPLYISALFKVMKEKGLHEGTIEQMYRLFRDRLYCTKEILTDQKGRIRMDDWEMRPDVQSEVANIWEKVTEENVYDVTDLIGYNHDFFQLFGFKQEGVDYEADVDQMQFMPHLTEIT